MLLSGTLRLCLLIGIKTTLIFGTPCDTCTETAADDNTPSEDDRPSDQIQQPDGFPRGKHGLGDSCDYDTWRNFYKDRNKLLEIIKTADPDVAADKDQLNLLLWEGQQKIIAKNYSQICYFHQYLECSVQNICECVNQAPPFNFELNDTECRGKRGALCDSDGDGIGHFECLPGHLCQMALPGNTAICGGKLGFDEELENFEKSKKNGGLSVLAIWYVVVLANATLFLHSNGAKKF